MIARCGILNSHKKNQSFKCVPHKCSPVLKGFFYRGLNLVREPLDLQMIVLGRLRIHAGLRQLSTVENLEVMYWGVMYF